MKHQLRILGTNEPAPVGWKQLSEWPDSERRILSDAHIAGDIPAAKRMRTPTDSQGPVYVPPAEAEAWLAKRAEAPKRAPGTPSEYKQTQRVRDQQYDDLILQAKSVDAGLWRLVTAAEKIVAAMQSLETCWRTTPPPPSPDTAGK